ncbi:MAG: hypothetical protein Q7S57_00470 [bacterium]|nr:hypothetical protein [bacterium]
MLKITLETTKSLKGFFLIIGMYEVYNIINLFKTFQGNLILGLVGIIGLIFGILYIYIGIKLNEIMLKSANLIVKCLIAQMVFFVLESLFTFIISAQFSVLVILLIDLCINFYLILNIKRLTKEQPDVNVTM